MVRSAGPARWCSHVNHVNASPEMRRWLTDRASLTVKLIARSSHFRVQQLRQQQGRCLTDEYAAVQLPRCVQVRKREVLLCCDEAPMVFAHTIVPMTANAFDWPFFNALGERSLGTTLFGDPRVVRSALQFARLHARHSLVQRAGAAIGTEFSTHPLFARRCLFQRNNGTLLVTEVFLPAIAGIRLPVTA